MSRTDLLVNIKVTIRSESSFFFVVNKSESRINIPNICLKKCSRVLVSFYSKGYEDNKVLYLSF